MTKRVVELLILEQETHHELELHTMLAVIILMKTTVIFELLLKINGF
jgi:hypothetical protein